jgi:hypothetical protein
LPSRAQLEKALKHELNVYYSLCEEIPELSTESPVPEAALISMEHVLMTRPASATPYREELRLSSKRLAALLRDKENN